MAYGKEIFRDKCREVNSSLDIIKTNYLALDYEYQMLSKRVNEAIEEINYMITNADITEISAIKLKQILGDKENE